MQRSKVDEHVQNTIAKFRNDIHDKCKNECHTMKDAFEELRHKYCSETPRYIIFKRAHVAENALRRISSDKHYNGMEEVGCIKLALALGVDNLRDINKLLNARGFAGLSKCKREDYILWHRAVKKVIRLSRKYEDDILPEDMVFIFEKLVEV